MKLFFMIAFVLSSTLAYAGPTPVAPASNDAKIKKNTMQPVTFEGGVGGITMQTTLAEAAALLSTPMSGPDSSGDAYYEDGLYIRWNMESPQTPVFVLVLSGYGGDLQVPGQSPLKMNQPLPSQYAPGSKTALENFARDYYRFFENATPGEDCIATAACEVQWGYETQKDAILVFPSMSLLVSKDSFVLFRIMLLPAL